MPPKKKAANGYKFAEPLPKGTIVEDIAKKRWRLGPSIGKGGFGEIYSAQEESAKDSNYPYVVKIEPHSNGPLFVEINFYIRHAKAIDIENFKKKKGLKTFGMPIYNGSGSHEYKGEKYRFLVMNKFSTDLHRLYVDNNKTFPVDTVFKIGLQLLDVLEYIHERDYVHADIKAANVLLGTSKEAEKQVYLVDFGLATKFSIAKEFKPNPKKAHDGTIEFLSRDAHQGVQTRRGDLEVLGYNLIQWLGGKLPWESNLGDPKLVQKSKEDNMSSVLKIIKACFGTKPHPKALVDYLTYLKSLQFNSEPDYEKIRTIFMSGIKEGGGSVGTPLKFSQEKTSLKRPVNRKKKQEEQVSDGDEENEIKKTRGAKKPKTLTSNVKRGNGIKSKEQINTAEESDNDMAGFNDEMKEIARSKQAKRTKKQEQVVSDADDDEPTGQTNEIKKTRGTKKPKTLNINGKRGKVNKAQDSDDDMAGFTDEMKEIARSKQAKQTNGTSNITVKRGNPWAEANSDDDDDMVGYTAEMKAIALSKKSKLNRKRGTKKNPVEEGDGDTKAATTTTKRTKNIPVATSSKASTQKGLVQPTSRRLREKPPLNHGDVANYSHSSSLSD